MRDEGMTEAEAIQKMNEPQTHDAIFAQAAADSYATIFQNDNLAVSLYRTMIARLMNAGKEGSVTNAAGKLAGRAFEFALPIVKVPTNVVAEGGSYLGGGIKAATQIALAKGVKNLTPEQADYVARNLQKQTVGAALLVLGALDYKSFGGYYQTGDSKKNRTLQPDTAKVGDTTIPRWLFHTPVMQMAQLGATFARVWNEDKHGTRWNEAEKVGNAGFQAVKGLLEQVPFSELVTRLPTDFKDIESVERSVGAGARNMLIPPDVQRYAKSQDPLKGRKPHGAWDEFKMGLPWGPRETVQRH
jgi:hypothetical protein